MSRRRYMLNGKEFDNGEYILRTNNLLYTKDEWNTQWNSEAVGVALLTDNIRVVIPAKRIYDSFSSKSTAFQGVVTTTYIDIARTDFNGLSNTQNIIKQSQKVILLLMSLINVLPLPLLMVLMDMFLQ